MLQNYIKIALRALAKNKLYAFINVFGLAIGLAIYLFGNIMAEYENNHDTNWDGYERIFYVASELSPQANIGVRRMETTFSAHGPLFKEGIPEVEYMARTLKRQYLVSIGEDHFDETVRFADADLLRIFSFSYIEGDESALDDPSGAVLTESQAMKLFGRTDVRGEMFQLDHTHEFRVQAVIEDLPKDSHFVSSVVFSEPYDMILPVEGLMNIEEWEGNYYNTSSGHYTYLKTYEPISEAELSPKLNAIHLAHTPEDQIERFMESLYAKNITRANTGIWDMIGMPVIETVEILGLLILVIAIVNYTNLATAQSLGRTREVGMRKALGASRTQLMFQFLTESLTIAALSMVMALVFVEIIVPIFNNATGKILALDYLTLIPYLLLTTLIVGVVAGGYPSYLITKTNTIFALKGMSVKGGKGNLIRSGMICVQFMLSIFMLGMVLIVFFQNEKVRESSSIFPKDEVLVLNGIQKQDIRDREDVLKAELQKIPGVAHVTFASHIPFGQSNNSTSITKVEGDIDAKMQTNRMWADDSYLDTFGIKLLAGRNFSKEITTDYYSSREVRSARVIINELLREQLGFSSNEEAVNESFYAMPNDDGLATFRYEIIGVMETLNIQGLHNDVKPYMLAWSYWIHEHGAVRIASGAPTSVISDIEQTLKRVIPEYPIEHEFLSGVFESVYNIFRTMNNVLAGFAAVALTLALIGLFGLAAFMARTRTKEIGIRKVLGASIPQLVKMMLWQFSKPIMWAILIALPLAYFASGAYLNFFSDRLDMSIQLPLITIGGMTAVALSWVVISLHAIKVARSNPVNALHYE